MIEIGAQVALVLELEDRRKRIVGGVLLIVEPAHRHAPADRRALDQIDVRERVLERLDERLPRVSRQLRLRPEQARRARSFVVSRLLGTARTARCRPGPGPRRCPPAPDGFRPARPRAWRLRSPRLTSAGLGCSRLGSPRTSIAAGSGSRVRARPDRHPRTVVVSPSVRPAVARPRSRSRAVDPASASRLLTSAAVDHAAPISRGRSRSQAPRHRSRAGDRVSVQITVASCGGRSRQAPAASRDRGVADRASHRQIGLTRRTVPAIAAARIPCRPWLAVFARTRETIAPGTRAGPSAASRRLRRCADRRASHLAGARAPAPGPPLPRLSPCHPPLPRDWLFQSPAGGLPRGGPFGFHPPRAESPFGRQFSFGASRQSDRGRSPCGRARGSPARGLAWRSRVGSRCARRSRGSRSTRGSAPLAARYPHAPREEAPVHRRPGASRSAWRSRMFCLKRCHFAFFASLYFCRGSRCVSAGPPVAIARPLALGVPPLRGCGARVDLQRRARLRAARPRRSLPAGPPRAIPTAGRARTTSSRPTGASPSAGSAWAAVPPTRAHGRPSAGCPPEWSSTHDAEASVHLTSCRTGMIGWQNMELVVAPIAELRPQITRLFEEVVQTALQRPASGRSGAGAFSLRLERRIDGADLSRRTARRGRGLVARHAVLGRRARGAARSSRLELRARRTAAAVRRSAAERRRPCACRPNSRT